MARALCCSTVRKCLQNCKRSPLQRSLLHADAQRGPTTCRCRPEDSEVIAASPPRSATPVVQEAAPTAASAATRQSSDEWPHDTPKSPKHEVRVACINKGCGKRTFMCVFYAYQYKLCVQMDLCALHTKMHVLYMYQLSMCSTCTSI